MGCVGIRVLNHAAKHDDHCVSLTTTVSFVFLFLVVTITGGRALDHTVPCGYP